MTVPEDLVQQWESVYRRYAEVSKASGVAGDRDTVREMASASREVAVAWRAMESTPDLPWWVLAALSAGAQAFEVQAREWYSRADAVWPVDNGGFAGPQRSLSARPRPTPHRRTAQKGEARG